jgi:radical S-adenosyl methionine domain-containing protein 2
MPKLTVNWHLEKDCNYNCSFCYAQFEDVKANTSVADGLSLLQELANAGVYKINFAGGEPLLNKSLGKYLQRATSLGMKTSIITNASLLKRSWLMENGAYIDQVGISCDSLDEQVNKSIGRGFGHHVAVTTRAIAWIRALNEDTANNFAINVKLNTVVLKDNHLEEWTDFIKTNAPLRWKVFRVLQVKGENDDVFDDLSITDDEFNAFKERHKALNDVEGVVVANEDNCDMTTSYVMMTPDGRLYQNSDADTQGYLYSENVLAVGFEKALASVGFDYSKYVRRGGVYNL